LLNDALGVILCVMQTYYASFVLGVGTVLAVIQIVGIPLVWKQWLSAGIGLLLIGWGLYARYGHKATSSETHE